MAFIIDTNKLIIAVIVLALFFVVQQNQDAIKTKLKLTSRYIRGLLSKLDSGVEVEVNESNINKNKKKEEEKIGTLKITDSKGNIKTADIKVKKTKKLKDLLETSNQEKDNRDILTDNISQLSLGSLGDIGCINKNKDQDLDSRNTLDKLDADTIDTAL